MIMYIDIINVLHAKARKLNQQSGLYDAKWIWGRNILDIICGSGNDNLIYIFNARTGEDEYFYWGVPITVTDKNDVIELWVSI